MVPNTSGSDDSLRRAALLLHREAGRLAAAGATSDTVFTGHLADVPPVLRSALEKVIPLPDRTEGWCVLRGLLSGFGEPGPTPEHWKSAKGQATEALDIALVLIGEVIGGVFGWTGQQDGRLVHNILPSRGQEQLQVGASSTTALAWHTEDAFHPRRAELVMLTCVRNDDRIGSEVASIRRAGLDERELALLSRPHLRIMPDDSYPACSDADGTEQPGMATVWFAEDGPCLRYDPSYTGFLVDDPTLVRAHAGLGDRLTGCREVIDLEPGDILLIDNDVAVHGRSAFRPRYDGTDRWLKRILIRLPRPRPAGQEAEDGFAQTLVGARPGPEVR
ncbi:TauD/TfdA family dioxygenase [Amycolatopsis sp. cmx-4-61]|uniref:TauD/TfdA family dioxygenase n=1 Tax=Amycolatopsis sp. cmx-4-61 TaxID=2790937 RepID=UPI00397DB0D3